MSYYDHQQQPPVGVPPPQGLFSFFCSWVFKDSFFWLLNLMNLVFFLIKGYPPKDAYPPPGYPAQGYPQQGYPPQGYPPQQGYGYPPPQYTQQPPPQRQEVGFLEGWYVTIFCLFF
jgi:hypothetical protein